MGQITIQCKNCTRVFKSGFGLGDGATATFSDNKSQCPGCGSWESLPDGTFRGTVEGFIRILEEADNPNKEAQNLLDSLLDVSTDEDLEKVKNNPKFSRFAKWLPNSIERVAAYIAIIYTVTQMLTKDPDVSIEYNQFINNYNITIDIGYNSPEILSADTTKHIFPLDQDDH